MGGAMTMKGIWRFAKAVGSVVLAVTVGGVVVGAILGRPLPLRAQGYESGVSQEDKEAFCRFMKYMNDISPLMLFDPRTDKGLWAHLAFFAHLNMERAICHVNRSEQLQYVTKRLEDNWVFILKDE